MRFFVTLTALLCAAAPVAAQHAHGGGGAEVKGTGRLPDGWNARIDKQPANAALERLNLMQMGANTLHAQMGMANAIFWNAKNDGQGEFEVSATSARPNRMHTTRRVTASCSTERTSTRPTSRTCISW